MKKGVNRFLLVFFISSIFLILLTNFVSASFFGDTWSKITGRVTYTTYNVNVAFNKTATEYVPSPGESKHRLSPMSAVDGNLGSWWATGSYNPASLMLDLWSEYTINNYTILCGGVSGGNKGDIHFYNGIGNEVAVRNYTCTGYGTTKTISAVFNPAIRVRSVRVNAMSPPGGDWINVNELQLWSTSSVCNPECSNKNCGDDSCGGICGTCGNSQSCSDGKCVNNPTCTDYDGGKNYYTKGTLVIIGPSNNVISSQDDTCTVKQSEGIYKDSLSCSGSECYVRDNYCVGSQFSSSFFQCPNGCYDGACLNQTCSDSDNGLDYYTRGYLKNNLGANFEDYCLNSSELIERHCLSNNSNDFTKQYTCPSGCKDGACVKQRISGITGNLDSYAQKQNINLVVNGIEEDGSAASNDEGWNVQYYTYSVKDNDSYMMDYIPGGNYNGVYKNGYWYVDYWAPSSPGSYYTEITLYCSRENSSCWKETGGHGYEAKEKIYFKVTGEVIPTCTDSDLGNNIYVKGQVVGPIGSGEGSNGWDYCYNGEGSFVDKTGKSLLEWSCTSDNSAQQNIYECPNGCYDGACVKTTPVKNEVCQDLINQIANPSDLMISDQLYRASYNGRSYNGSMWINDSEYTYIGYDASWSSNNENYDYNSNSNEEKNYEYGYLYPQIMVFDDKTVDLTGWLKEKTSYQICTQETYWDYNNDKSSVVYICSWENDEIKNPYKYDTDAAEIFWINGNVLVSAYVYSGSQLNNKDILDLSNRRVNEVIDSLKDNSNKYKKFSVSYLNLNFIEDSLKKCPSKAELPIVKENETCNSHWECKIEPVICPEYGYQKRVCKDYGCNQQREEQIYCSPGICSGCYVPRWFDSGTENICMPYASRFEKETSNIVTELVERTQDQTIAANGPDHDYSLNIVSENQATFTIFGRDGKNYTYELTPGAEVEIKIPDWSDEIDTITLYVKKIVYSSEEGSKNYVDVTVKVKGYEKTQEKIPMYCDYDGVVKKQKIGDLNSLVKCQNNFECESNLCSSGECIELAKMIKEGSKLKGLFVKALCRIVNLFDDSAYTQCVADNL